MKVHQIISEAEVQEGPLNWAMKKLGSKAAANRADIGDDVARMYKDYEGIWKMDPVGGPTFTSLYKYLHDQGLPVGTPDEFRKIATKFNNTKSIGQKTWKHTKTAAKGVGAATKYGVDKAKQGYKAVKKGLEAEPTQMSFAGMNDSVNEANKRDMIEPGKVKTINNHFPRLGFVAGANTTGTTSKFGVNNPSASTGTDQPKKKKSTAGQNQDSDINRSIKFLKSQGYTVTKA